MTSKLISSEDQAFLSNCSELLDGVKRLALDYEVVQNRRENIDIGFNLFELISDHYQRETFHSDILKELLDPKAKHGEQQLFLNLFLEFLNSHHNAGIDRSLYVNASVEKEEAKIDILIKGSKHAIIIENKINDAKDEHRQIPRYLEVAKAKGYICDCIVYLRLNRWKYPDTTDWTSEEENEAKSKLRVVLAYDDSKENLLHAWITKCADVSKSFDAKHIIRQYGGIIKKLGINIMNEPIMEKFCALMGKGENLKTALTLQKMMSDLIAYRAQKIHDDFKSDRAPFKDIGITSQKNDVYFKRTDKHGPYGIDIGIEPDGYSFQFWNLDDRAGVKGEAKALLEKVDCFDKYKMLSTKTSCEGDAGVFFRRFEFPSEEEALFEHLKAFMQKLSTV
jgi:hypothetical protein